MICADAIKEKGYELKDTPDGKNNKNLKQECQRMKGMDNMLIIFNVVIEAMQHTR